MKHAPSLFRRRLKDRIQSQKNIRLEADIKRRRADELLVGASDTALRHVGSYDPGWIERQAVSYCAITSE
jgi:hypothetical protein